MKANFWKAAALTTATWLVAGPAHAILIDNFNSGDGFVANALPGPTNFATIVGDAIGNSRTMQMNAGANLTGMEVAGGVLTYGGSGPPPGQGKLTWDTNGAGLMGIDLTEGGANNGLSIDILAIDIGSVDLQFMFTDSGGMVSSLDLMGLGVGKQMFLFSNFVGTADLSDIDSIMLTIDADSTSDLTLDIVETVRVPAPAPLLLMGIGLAGLLASRKRQLG